MKTLYYGGKVLTMAEPLYAEAVLTEDGKICAVGSLEELEAQAGNCNRTDLGGAVMLPGFIDPHSHFFQVAASFLQAGVNGCNSAEKMASAIQSFIRDRKIAPG